MKLQYLVPGVGALELTTIILDLNGTLTVRGKIVEGVHERLATLKSMGFRIVFFTGNTRGNADELAKELGIEWVLAETGKAKRDAALKMDPLSCVSIGNGLIDLELMKVVKLGITITGQAEGYHVATLMSSQMGLPTIVDALDFLIDPPTLVAGLRK